MTLRASNGSLLILSIRSIENLPLIVVLQKASLMCSSIMKRNNSLKFTNRILIKPLSNLCILKLIQEFQSHRLLIPLFSVLNRHSGQVSKGTKVRERHNRVQRIANQVSIQVEPSTQTQSPPLCLQSSQTTLFTFSILLKKDKVILQHFQILRELSHLAP